MAFILFSFLFQKHQCKSNRALKLRKQGNNFFFLIFSKELGNLKILHSILEPVQWYQLKEKVRY